jgi:hypothetical protein
MALLYRSGIELSLPLGGIRPVTSYSYPGEIW